MTQQFSLKRLVWYFLKLGTIGFGGSVALAHAMQTDLVEKDAWLSETQFLQGLTLSQLAPGPLAAQLAIYIGFVKARILGATLAGLAFVLPSFLIVLGLALLYQHFGQISFITAALYGIGAGVIGIIASSGYALTKRTMKKKALLWVLYAIMFAATVLTRSTNVLLFIGAGIVTMIVYTKEKLTLPKKPSSFAMLPFALPSFPILATLFQTNLVKIFVFFFLAGSIAFGGGLAIVPYLQNGVIAQFHWLTNKQFVDAVAVAMITPGPVVIAATFIGYFAGNIPGAILATLAIFLPVYLIVIFLTPIFHKHAQNPHMVAFVEGVLAAAMASIAGSIILLGMDSIVDIPTFFLALAAFIATKFFKVPSVVVVIAAAVIGILVHR